MAEMCSYCAGSFATPAELVLHVRKDHSGGDSRTSLAMNPESRKSGVVCALCGRRFANPRALARHALSPHPPTMWPAESIYTRRPSY